MNTDNLPVVATPRSCARCGRNFAALGREQLCAACKRPELTRRRIPRTRELSQRQRQIVGLIQQAKANKEIASELRIAQGTVKEYLHLIFRKVGVKNRTELALWRKETEQAGILKTPAVSV